MSSDRRAFLQLRALLKKRARIFFARTFIGVTMLSFPFIMECVFTLIIPSNTNLVNLFAGQYKVVGNYRLDIAKYGRFHLPYFLNESETSPAGGRSLLNNFYARRHRPTVELVKLNDSNVAGFVRAKRADAIGNLISDYYIGLGLFVKSPTKLSAHAYYSTLALHSSAVAVDEFSNLLLAFLTNSYNRSIRTTNAPISSYNSLYNGENYLEYLACMDVLPTSLIDMLNSIIIAFIASATVIHVTRERENGSKLLQSLSGASATVYWLSNYVFDMAVCLFNIATILFAMKLIAIVRNDPTNELAPISTNVSLSYVALLLVASSFTWCTYAYILSFFFKSDILGFIISMIVLCVASFLDMIWSIIHLFLNLDTASQGNFFDKCVVALKYIFLIAFPNVTVKSGLYNIKIRLNDYCINSLNQILKSKPFL